ncbi:MAG: 4Fe-4S dicluster domain-containing protein [Candidatus Omnitrophota bacterium]
MQDDLTRGKLSRKEFLKLSALAGAALAGSGAIDAVIAGEKSANLPAAKWKKGDDILLRMQDDLNRALLKSLKERNWAMLIDLRKCAGCLACTIACKAENVSPPQITYRHVLELEAGAYPFPRRDFVPVLCNHCENAPCVAACPVKGATNIRADGIVDMDYPKCIGCKACISACPYGARYFDAGEFYTASTPKIQGYETRPTFDYKQEWPRKKDQPPIGKVRKCHFCIHRIERGVLPACVTTCIGKATYFGDRSDDESLVGELLAQSKVHRLKEDLGTEPRVYYIGLEGIEIPEKES